MRNASAFVGVALVAASLALAGPASATPAVTQGLADAAATAAAAPGAIGTNGATSELSAQDAGLNENGARVGVGTADGFPTKAAADGTTIPSAFYKPAL